MDYYKQRLENELSNNILEEVKLNNLFNLLDTTEEGYSDKRNIVLNALMEVEQQIELVEQQLKLLK